MTLNQVKVGAVALVAILTFAVMAFRPNNVTATSRAADDDPAAIYKAKCAMCHTATASKFFDATVADDELVQAILKGKKGEKPPNMPAYGDKGITEDTAKALVAYMKKLKTGQ